MMTSRETLQAWDYAAIACTMLVSVAIGFYFRFTGSKQKTTDEFLMAGRSMKIFPAVFSLVATKLSAIAIIGEPTDVYLYGTQRCIGYVFIFIGSLVTAFLYLPVYFAIGASTIYQYLELRFGTKTRKVVSLLCYIQTLLNMSIVIYTPAISLSAVTELSSETSIILVGGVCILFSAAGGLRAVMWADVFQAMLMYGCLITVMTTAILEAGGLSAVYQSAYNNERMDFFKFRSDVDIPYNFWNSIAFGIQFGITHAVSQFEIQRLLAVKNLEKAQSAALWSSIPSFIMSFLTISVGLALFAVFQNCDPLSEKSGSGLTKSDQIVPYYIVSRLRDYPGLPGLCISGIFSASISSLSSALNSLSTVFVEDFIKVYLKRQTVAKINLNLCAKVLVVYHGCLIIGVAFLTSIFPSVLHGAIVLDGLTLGPTLGLYTLGILTQRTNETGALIGLLSGALLATWVGIGTSFFGVTYGGKPVGTDECNSPFFNMTSRSCSSNDTISIEVEKSEYIFPLYRISYMWTYCIGGACTVCLGYVSSYIINYMKGQTYVDPKLLSPITRHWVKKTPVETDISLKEEFIES